MHFFYGSGVPLLSTLCANMLLFRTNSRWLQVSFCLLAGGTMHFALTNSINRRFQTLVNPYYEKYSINWKYLFIIPNYLHPSIFFLLPIRPSWFLILDRYVLVSRVIWDALLDDQYLLLFSLEVRLDYPIYIIHSKYLNYQGCCRYFCQIQIKKSVTDCHFLKRFHCFLNWVKVISKIF